MTTKIDRVSHSRQFDREPGGWITCRVPQPEFDMNQLDLFAAPGQLQSGNLRFAIDGQHAYLIAELRDGDDLLTIEEAHERLFAAIKEPEDPVSHIDIAGALAAAGGVGEWSEVQPGQWQATADDARNIRCDLTAAAAPGGVEICGRLADWDTPPSEPSRSAIGRFFAAAHAQVRCVRFTLHDRQAIACSFAAADRIDVEVSDCVAAVLAAYRLVWREVRALADVAVAQKYLESVRR